MSVIYMLLAISIAVAIFFFTVFVISVKNGQYDDSYTPSVRILFEDELVNSFIEKQDSKNIEILEDIPSKRKGIEKQEKKIVRKVSSSKQNSTK